MRVYLFNVKSRTGNHELNLLSRKLLHLTQYSLSTHKKKKGGPSLHDATDFSLVAWKFYS